MDKIFTSQRHHLQKVILFCILMALSATLALSQEKTIGRGQWDENQAREWENRVGIIKGFNAPSTPFPGMDRIEILEKAASLGYNSVRIWIPKGAERGEEYLKRIFDEASKYNLTVSPVLRTNEYFDDYFKGGNKVEVEKEIKNYLWHTIGNYKNDHRIVFWDVQMSRP